MLEGPNLYFPRAAIKLTLDISGLADVPTERAKRFATRIGLRNARPGEPGTGFRQRFAARAVARLVRAVAHESGTSRLAVRVRPTSDPHQIVVAYPWRHRERAQEMGRAVADVLWRQEGLFRPAPWLQLAAGADLRANTHNEVEHVWRIDWEDRETLRPRLAVRRLAATVSAKGFTLDVGKQFIRWARADVLNPIDRFAIGDRDKLKFNQDGSLDIYIQAESPGADKESNWLPSPKSGAMGPTMRIYGPRPEALDGTWAPPPFKRVQ